MRFEQLSFWLNPIGALITIGFSVVFLILGRHRGDLDREFVRPHQAHRTTTWRDSAAYGVMAACFNILAISLVNRREMGLLKRLRLSPLPTWIADDRHLLNAMIVAAHRRRSSCWWSAASATASTGPHDWLPFIVTLVVGMLCFSALGVGMSTLVPNADAAGPMVSLVFFILVALSGLWFPIKRRARVWPRSPTTSPSAT